MLNAIAALIWNRREHRLRLLIRLLPAAYLWTALFGASRFLPLLYRYTVILGGMLILLGGLAVLMDRRSLKDYGFPFDRRFLPDLAFGVLLGAVLVGAIFFVMRALRWIYVTGGSYTYFANGDLARSLATMALVYIAVAITEEVVFRGVVMKNVAEGLSRWIPHTQRVWASVLVSALLFGYVHFDNPSATLLSNVNLVLFGVVLAIPYLLTGSLAITLGFHFSWNFSLILLGLPVSGFAPFASLLTLETGGLAWLSGGLFGPEGGLIGTVSLLFQAAGYLLWIRLTRGELRIWRKLGHYRPVRVFAMTPGEIRQERERLRSEFDTLQDRESGA